MADQDHPDGLSHPTVHYQRRSISFGGSPLEPCPDVDESTFAGVSTADNQCVIAGDDGNEYICAPLPRVDSRPTANTCWLVRALSFLGVMQFARSTVRTLLNPFNSTSINDRQQKFVFECTPLCPLLSLL